MGKDKIILGQNLKGRQAGLFYPPDHTVLQTDLSPELTVGGRLDLRGISVCEFAGGKIVRLSDYS